MRVTIASAIVAPVPTPVFTAVLPPILAPVRSAILTTILAAIRPLRRPRVSVAVAPGLAAPAVVVAAARERMFPPLIPEYGPGAGPRQWD
ncbi:MAG TPA: hypothetical protein VN915_11940 [Elusimicrobiota bacterium]|nr:hypothetical protein [Elusimicrobiota bacterium]